MKIHRLGCDCFEHSSQRRRAFITGSLAAAFSGLAGPSLSQQRLTISLDDSCSFYPDAPVGYDLYTFANNYEAIEVIDKLVKSVGLQQNFDVMQANVPNAAAVIQGSRRLVLYSQVFIDEINAQTETEWASWTILAHEIGHHLNGHTLDGLGSRPEKELEADYFAGFAVARIGGNKQQARSPFETMGEAGSQTHPPRSARLEAVVAGWNAGAVGRVPDADENDPEVAEGQPDMPPSGQAPPNKPRGVSAIRAEGVIDDLLQGILDARVPDVQMSPQMASVYSQQLYAAQSMLSSLGSFNAIEVTGNAPVSGGTKFGFVAEFSRYQLRGEIWFTTDGTVAGFQFQ